MCNLAGMIKFVSVLGLVCLFTSCSLNSKNSSPTEVVEEEIVGLALQDDTLDYEKMAPYLLGKFDQSRDSNFVRLKNEHTAGSGRGAYLQIEAYEAFIQMRNAAQKEGISLIIKSATRNFNYQKGIWERKWNGQTAVAGKNLARDVKNPYERALLILRYSSMPGTSRHHWGTDMDLNAFTNDYFESGQGLKEYEWLVAHAHEYGFCQPYTAKGSERPHGYEEEKWHWSYLPLAVPALAAYKALITADSIKGFEGALVADSLRVIQRYVLGVNEACK